MAKWSGRPAPSPTDNWYRAAGVALPALPFLDHVTYRFAIGDTAQH